MRKTDCLIDALFLLIYQIISCMVIYFASWLFVMILSRFIVLDYYVAAIIYSVLLIVGVGILMCLYAYHTAYRTAEFHVAQTVVASALSTFVHLLIAALFNYLPLLSGGALYLAGVMGVGKGFTSSDAHALIPGYLPLVLFLAIMLAYHALMMVLRRLAVNKRLTDRYELTGQL